MISKNVTPGYPVRLDLIKWLHVGGIVDKGMGWGGGMQEPKRHV